MARLTKKDIEKKSKQLYQFKAEYLLATPGFLNDMQKYRSIALSAGGIKNKLEKLAKIKIEIYKKYRIRVSYPPVDQNDCNKIWTHFDKPSIRIIENKPRFDLSNDNSIKKWDELKKRKPDEQIKRTLRDNKYLTLEIDVDMDEGLILEDIKGVLNWVKNEKIKYGLGASLTRIRPKDIEHNLKVYKAVEQAKESGNLSWAEISNRFYKKDTGGSSYAIRKVKRNYEQGRKFLYGR